MATKDKDSQQDPFELSLNDRLLKFFLVFQNKGCLKKNKKDLNRNDLVCIKILNKLSGVTLKCFLEAVLDFFEENWDIILDLNKDLLEKVTLRLAVLSVKNNPFKVKVKERKKDGISNRNNRESA